MPRTTEEERVCAAIKEYIANHIGESRPLTTELRAELVNKIMESFRTLDIPGVTLLPPQVFFDGERLSISLDPALVRLLQLAYGD